VDNREEVQKKLAEGISPPSGFTLQSLPLSIPTAVHYPIPLNEQPAYEHLIKGTETPIAAALAKRVMSLPMHANLSEENMIAITLPL